MDYFSILKLNSNATIIDIIGMYEVLLKNTKKEIKAGKSDISKLNELNMAFILACTTKNKDELVNVKNKYILNNKVIIIINKIKQTITTFKSASNIGFGIYFNKLIEILNEYLKGYYRLINQIRQAKNLDEFNKISDRVYDENEEVQYKDEGNEPISIQELEALYNTKEIKTLDDEFLDITVKEEKPDVEVSDIKVDIKEPILKPPTNIVKTQ